MERSELTADELVLPSSMLLDSFMGSLELVKLMVGKEIISRMLRIWEIPLVIGRNRGRQAPTIPSEDSTIGQYRVGVNRSFRYGSVNGMTFEYADSLTCKVLVTRIGLLTSIVVSFHSIFDLV